MSGLRYSLRIQEACGAWRHDARRPQMMVLSNEARVIQLRLCVQRRRSLSTGTPVARLPKSRGLGLLGATFADDSMLRRRDSVGSPAAGMGRKRIGLRWALF